MDPRLKHLVEWVTEHAPETEGMDGKAFREKDIESGREVIKLLQELGWGNYQYNHDDVFFTWLDCKCKQYSTHEVLMA